MAESWGPAGLGLRTSWAGELRPRDAGRRVTLCGWVHRRRDHGGVIFVDLRDRSGVVQVVVRPEAGEAFAAAERLRPEWVVRISGPVVVRDPELVNPRLPTGEVEVRAEEVEVLSEAATPPISPAEEVEVDETLRLRYRYLDLRRPEMAASLALRHRLALAVRRFLDAQGFLEIETPMLTRSTPEGARDYLVPSRVYPGRFFALPQSPQLFKQLLMVAGLERYFQIVRCFRDEDLRADRQPEFTQIDIEMSFVTREAVLDLTERMMAHAVAEAAGWELPLPLPRLAYREAIARYGSDKPDLRFGLEIADVTELLAGAEHEALRRIVEAEGGRIRALAVPDGGARLARREIDALIEVARQAGASGLLWLARSEAGWRGPLARALGEGQIGRLLAALGAKSEDLILVCAGAAETASGALGAVRLEVARRLGLGAGRHAWVWVVEFPLFEREASTGGLSSVHHPFTAPLPEDEPLLEEAPLRVRAQAYDLVLDGIELGGGSLRIHRPDLQRRVFRLLGLSDETAQEKFGFLLEAFRYGAPPHGGIALGLDRIAMLLAGRDTIRDVIAFPKTARAHDPLTDAPAPVEPHQLEELGIAVVGRARGEGAAGYGR